jgi:hypothetical protein
VHNGKQNIAAVAASLCEAELGCTRRFAHTATATEKQHTKSARRLCVQKKPGGKLDSPPGLKLGVVIPKAFGVVIERRALMPLFLR